MANRILIGIWHIGNRELKGIYGFSYSWLCLAIDELSVVWLYGVMWSLDGFKLRVYW